MDESRQLSILTINDDDDTIPYDDTDQRLSEKEENSGFSCTHPLWVLFQL